MSSIVSVPISILEGNYQGHPPATTVTADEIEIVVETTHPIKQDGASTSNVMQHIPSVSLPSGSNGVTEAALETPIEAELTSEGTGGEFVEAESSNLGNAQLDTGSPEIRLHPDLYNAAVNGDVDLLTRFVESQGCAEKNMLDWNQFCGLDSLKGVSIGDNTVLHIVAASSSHHLERRPTSNYVEFVDKVYRWNKTMLTARNKLKETPVHCAAQAGNYTIFSRLIFFLKDEHQDVVESILLARNIHGETALHEAVRVGDIKIVKDLISLVPGLTGIVDAGGVSPLYLATMLNNLDIVKAFTGIAGEDASLVSCAGPKGHTALHAAVLEYYEITCELLEWDDSLATKVDDLNSTPLHYAASAGHLGTVILLLQHDTSAAYMADIKGLYPIHVAAKCGWMGVIKELIEKIPDSGEFLDKKGRNFLHTAIIRNEGHILSGLHENPAALRMLNARDYQGNTPLHLASERGRYDIVRFLISVKVVHSSVMNRDGLTPVDHVMRKLDHGFNYALNSQFNVVRCLTWTGALYSPRRADKWKDDLKIPNSDTKKEVEKAESSTRSLGLISVLIATITFAAIFTMPGGYIAGDDVNSGAPILSRKYTFKAFLVADMLAFILSIFATSWLIYAGSTTIDFNLRLTCLVASVWMVKYAAKATICAFALAVYTMLAHINLPICILVFVSTVGLLPFSNPSAWGFILLAPPIVKRSGWWKLIRSNFSRLVWWRLIENLALYVVIFLLALL